MPRPTRYLNDNQINTLDVLRTFDLLNTDKQQVWIISDLLLVGVKNARQILLLLSQLGIVEKVELINSRAHYGYRLRNNGKES